MNKEQISFADIREGDRLILEGGYTTSQPVTALRLDRIPADADGPYAGQWAWYFVESAPLVGQRCFIGETRVYRVLPEDEYEYAVTWLYSLTGKHYGVAEYQWTTHDKALAQAVEAEEEDGREGVKLVKRRKAGKVENA